MDWILNATTAVTLDGILGRPIVPRLFLALSSTDVLDMKREEGSVRVG